MGRTALISGANGYLGSIIRDTLRDAGWETIALVRSPRPRDSAVRWSLGDAAPPDFGGSVDALVHCAYDFTPRSREDVRRVNVDGSRRLLEWASQAGVRRSLVLSSMSAYAGCEQIYGQAKLEIEALTTGLGGVAVRPGLVYGDEPRGMAGTLVKLSRLPVAPDLGPSARQFPVHEEDLTATIRMVLEASGWKPEVFGIAQAEPIDFRTFLSFLAAGQGHDCRFVRVPWRAVYGILRAAEAARVSPLRADSILGLVQPAPAVPRSSAFPELLGQLRSIDAPGSRRGREKATLRDSRVD